MKSRVDAQFERLYLIHDPPQEGAGDADLALGRDIQKGQLAQSDETRGGLRELRRNLGRDRDKVEAHHRVHSQFISFMASNYAAQALIRVCAAGN